MSAVARRAASWHLRGLDGLWTRHATGASWGAEREAHNGCCIRICRASGRAGCALGGDERRKTQPITAESTMLSLCAPSPRPVVIQILFSSESPGETSTRPVKCGGDEIMGCLQAWTTADGLLEVDLAFEGGCRFCCRSSIYIVALVFDGLSPCSTMANHGRRR